MYFFKLATTFVRDRWNWIWIFNCYYLTIYTVFSQHSSSGVSSGSSDTASNEDKNGGPHSPTPSSSSSQGTVKRSPNSGANSVVSSGTKVSSVSVVQTRPPRHLKQRKEVFKPGTPSSINGKTRNFLLYFDPLCTVDTFSIENKCILRILDQKHFFPKKE